MRIALDPVPLVLGIYAHVGRLLSRAAEKHEDDDAEALGRKFGGRREHEADRDIQKMVRTLHSDVKIADKLLRKSGDVWKISQETDLVELVVHPRGDGSSGPRTYILLKPDEIRALLGSITNAARGAGESEETVEQLEQSAESIEARPGDYLAFGFDPWSM